jgi:glycosyltransferase involved in cell wall biosynthesis
MSSLGWRPAEGRLIFTMKSPQVSVILCTYNRAVLLEQALASLAQQALPEDSGVEILVVDNNSPDHTARVVQGFMSRHPERFRYVFEKRQGKSYALNTGIQEARGEIMAFTDDDVTFHPGWLTELVGPFDQAACLGVGGRIVPVWTVNKPEWLQLEGPHRLMSTIVRFDLGEDTCPLKTSPFGANMAFRREAFRKYGLFRTDLGPNAGTEIRGEDTEFCRRLINAGESLVYAPRSIVYHPVEKRRTEKSYFLSWYFDYGRATVRENGRSKNWLSVFGIPAYYLFRSLPLHLLRWILATSPPRRFYFKLNTYLILGKLSEYFALRKERVREESLRKAP